ncbi:MAG: hypothetical protein ACYTEP_07735 [Planctomycetota bacterium]|jgi:hypothetical protein
MKLTPKTLLPVIALSVAGSAQAQSGIVDQSELHDNVSWNMDFFNDMQQDIRVGIAGELQGFRVRIASNNVANGLDFQIFLGPGPHNAPTSIWTGKAFVTTAGPWEWVYLDCSAAGLHFDVGDVFTIRAGNGLTFSSGVSLTGNSGWPNPFYTEPFYEDQLPRTTDRLTFETFVDPDPSDLLITGTCGGQMTFNVSNGSGNYWIVSGNAGSSSPGGIDLAIANPTLRGTMGPALIVNVPAGACGQTVQVVDMAYLVASNAVVL